MSKQVIDIYSKGEYPADRLSNFYPHEFVIDGIKCAGMEGFLQSLKCKNPQKQLYVCGLYGEQAKNAGADKKLWKFTGLVHWQGKAYRRSGKKFAALISRAYDCLFENKEFYDALNCAKGSELIHSKGKDKKRETILTTEEFISNLNRLTLKIK